MEAEVKEEQDNHVEMKMDRRWWNRMGVNGSKNGSWTRWGRWRNGSGGRSEDEEEDNKNN